MGIFFFLLIFFLIIQKYSKIGLFFDLDLYYYFFLINKFKNIY